MKVYIRGDINLWPIYWDYRTDPKTKTFKSEKPFVEPIGAVLNDTYLFLRIKFFVLR